MPPIGFRVSSVITKGFIRCKYFHSVRLNSTISCKFHTARPGFVRGVVGKNHPGSGESKAGLEKLTGPEDFFGIESDKGVIHVKEQIQPCSKKSTDSSSISSSEKEQLLRTSFGHLRFDSYNQPKKHGQFEDNIVESEFMYGINVEKKRMQDVKAGEGDIIYKFYRPSSSKKEKRYSIHCTKQGELIESEDVVVKSCANVHEESELGFIDKAYFYDESSTTTSGSSDHKENTNLDSNILDNIVQRKEVDDDKEFLQNSFTDQHKGGSSFIDSIYFDGLYDANCSSSPGHSHQAESKPVTSAENHTDDCVDISSEIKNEHVCKELGFIDSMYFGTGAENTLTAQNNGNLDVCSSKISKVKDMYPNSMLEAVSKDSRLHSSSSLELNERTKENLSSPVEQNYMANVSENEAGLSQGAVGEKKLIKELERELNVTEVEHHGCQTPPGEDTLHSAYKYVLQLRKTGTKPNTQKGVKCDSKGFRILTNLVPDLSQLTRNELTDLLKELVLFSNDEIVILNKPYNLVIHESETTKVCTLSSVLDDLARKLDPNAANPQLYTVHRLDKETTGCFLLARSEIAAQKLKGLFIRREIEKSYLVVTTRVPDPYEGVIDMPIAEGKIENKVRMVLQPDIPKEIKYRTHVKNGKKAITHYKVVGTSENAALLEVRPETGLKHQIRVHLGFGLNCPILGDHKYSHLTKLAPQKLPRDILRKLDIQQSKVRYVPMHIHSRTVAIPKYLQGRDLFVSAPLPKHIRDTLKRLKFKDM